MCPTAVKASSQQDVPVTISIRNATLADILQKISVETGVDIYFRNTDLSAFKGVALEVKGRNLSTVLHELLDKRGLTWVKNSESSITVMIAKRSEGEKVADSTNVTLTGRVTDEKGNPIIGASVMVKGTRTGAVTSQDGTFRVKAGQANGSLIVSSVGFLTKEVAVNSRASVGEVQLKEYVGNLDEVQVQAYGTTTRRLSTGNISTVKAKDIEKSPVLNPLLAIVGRVPGVTIEQSNGNPGSGITVRIQGRNSIGYGNDPFYVIDGVPYTSQMLPGLGYELGDSGDPGLGGSRTGGNPLNFINPQDIESIDILKDADATSIYGSRAANGAIIITTKKGKSGDTKVDINAQYGWGTVTRRQKLLNTQEYIEMRKEAYSNENLPLPSIQSNPNSTAFDINGFWDQKRYSNWQKELLGETAKYTNILGTMSGGNSNTQYLVNFGYQSQGTITKGDLRDKRGSLHFNLNNTSTNKKLKFTLSGTYMNDDNKLATISSIVTSAYTLPPNAPRLYNNDGTLNYEIAPNGNPSFVNPLGALFDHYLNKTTSLLSSSLLSYQLTKDLEIKSNFGYNRLQSDEVSGATLNHLPPALKTYAVRSSRFNRSEFDSWIIEPQIKFEKLFQQGRIDILAGATFQQETRDREQINASGFTTDESMFNLKAASSVVVDIASNAVMSSLYKYNAFFARLNYNYNERYFISLTARRDGSSRFGKENKFHNFGSVGVAWTFSNETFFERGISVLSFGKIRASYGTTGSDQIGDYSYLNLYQNISTDGVAYLGSIGLEPFDQFPNPYLQWEETKKFSTTLDLGFVKDRVILNITYYLNQSSNQLLGLPLPSITGEGGVRTNLPATVRNSGFELSIGGKNILSDLFSWSTSFNLTIPRNRLLKYSGVDVDAKSDLIGKSVGTFKAYHFLGVDESSGRYVFADLQNKPTSIPNSDLDKTAYIDLSPKYYGGIQNSISYKNLSLDLLVQFTSQIGNNGLFGEGNPGFSLANQPTTLLQRWKRIGDKTNIQRVGRNQELNITAANARESDKYYSDASYWRLKNLSLSYQISPAILRKINIHNARVYFQGQNLITITKYVGVDPENRSFSSLPPLKILTVGIQATF
jgi:TonB-linked SusC/RagA family outer membrane protein